MADDTKPKTSLDDIAKLGTAYGALSNVTRTTDPYLNSIAGYFKSTGTDPDSMPDVGNRPEQFGNVARIKQESTRKGLVAATEAALDDVVKNLGQDRLTSLAVSIGLKGDKDYQLYMGALQGGNTEAIRKKYMELYGKDESFAYFAATANADQLFTFAKIQLDKKEKELIKKNLSREVEKEDKKTKEKVKVYEFDPEKAQGYLLKLIKGEKDKGAREELYLTTGITYAEQKAEAAKKKK